ncbi:MAG: transposase, partial [Spirochaetia bacterium]|nr:transposase [Spirochaetia bacterium]
RKYETQLAQAQRRLSKKKKGSQNWYKAKHNAAIVHETIDNSRADFNRKLATYLVTNYDAICIETLSLKGMSRALRLGKSVHDLGYAEFVARLKQKAETTGTHIIQADQWFASSKLCSVCGFKNQDLQLHERNWTCQNCQSTHSRDENAGKNLRNVGLDILGLGKPSEPVEKVLDVETSVPTQSSVKQEAHRPLLMGKSQCGECDQGSYR